MFEDEKYTKEKIDIVHIIEPVDFMLIWETIQPGFLSIKKYSHKDNTLNIIISDIISGRVNLYIVYNDDKYAGFVTCFRQQIMYDDVLHYTLKINHFYKQAKVFNKSVNEFLNNFFDNLAEGLGCRFVSMNTTRIADRYWNALGFQRGYTEYIKDLEVSDG